MQPTWDFPALKPLDGSDVQLLPLNPERDAPRLFEASHGTPEREALWRYLPYGPFESSAAMQSWQEKEFAPEKATPTWTVFQIASQQPVGSVSLLNIVPEHGRAEIGHVWFGTQVQRTKVNTESQYLLLRYLFDDLHYRRVEWKCNSLNHASRTAAARMGFIYEGRFRQHMVIKGKNRDTDWFAMTDKEWSRCKNNFEIWLQSDGSTSLADLNSQIIAPAQP